MGEDKKINRCRYSIPSMQSKSLEWHCHVDGWEAGKIKTVTEDVCKACQQYSSRYIEYPLTIQGIEDKFADNCKRSLSRCGQLVKVAPCGDEYGGKTYLGILLGDLPIGATVSFHPDDQKLHIGAMTNPAIFIPEFKKIVYGAESWWSEITRPEELKSITPDDIEKVWYVRLLNEMCKGPDQK